MSIYPRRISFLNTILLITLSVILLQTEAIAGRTLVVHRPLVSFAHFLYGTSGVFPPAAAFNRDLLAWKSVLDTSTAQALDRVALWFRSSIAKFETEHAFETAYYQAAAAADDLDSLIRSLRTRGIVVHPPLREDFDRLSVLFQTHFAADQSLIRQELRRLNALPETRHFRRILANMDRFYRPDLRQATPLGNIEIVAIPLRLTPVEMQDLRSKGKNSIFGRNFGHLQIVELVLIPEVPDLARKMLSHLLGV
ncbi:MAG TPA: hypothetical protein PKO06_19195, partial [Candidatus Ozemobacteraceae bacterium]|nr:hypothetical protein [Candidatus Ozemobacteraceae bacterium]